MKLIQLLFFFLIITKHGNSENIYLGAVYEENCELNKVFHYAIDSYNKDISSHDTEFVAISNKIPSNKPNIALSVACSLLSSGAIAIFGSRDHDNINSIQSVCDAKEIPHILTRWIYKPLRDSTVVNFYPLPSVLSKAYIDIVTTWDWKTFTLLYEDNESLMRMADLITACQLKSITVSIKQLDKHQSGIYRSTLREVRASEQKNLIIDCQIQHLEEILHQAQQVGLMTHEFHYIITNLDLHTTDLTDFQYSQTNITGIRLINPSNEVIMKISQELFPNDKDNSDGNYCKLDTESALIIDAVTIFANTVNEMRENYNLKVKGLLCNDSESWEHGYSVINMMKHNTHSGLTGFINFDHEGFRSEFELEVLELKEEGIAKIGTWNSSYGINITRLNPESEDDDSGSLQNKTFIVITCLTKPYGMLKETQEPLYGNDRYEGFGIDLIHELSLMEGFNYTFIIREDKSNGVKDATGKWSGMIGDLIDHVADLAITDLTITSGREEAVDFTSPFMNLGISILFRKPGKAPPNFFSFAEPFAIDTWGMMALAYILVSLALFIMGRLCPDEWTNPYPCIEEPQFLINQFSFRNSFWFTIGSLMQQGTEIAPIGISTRMIAGMWWFFVLIMVSSYTANLAAFLTTENPIELFTDVESLVANAPQFNIRYGAKKSGSTLNFFKDSTIPLYKKIAEHIKDHPEDLVKENDDGVNLADTDRYAFFMESTSIEYETQRRCNLTQYGKLLDDKGYGIAMRKNSPYRKRLSLAILKLQSSGKIASLKRKWWEERRGGGQCAGEQESQAATPLNVKNVEGVFFVTIGGIIAAVICVIFEMLISTLKLSRKSGLSLKEAFKSELKAYININSNVKAVIPSRKSKSKSKNSSKTTESLNNENSNSKPEPYGFIASVNSSAYKNLLNLKENGSN